MLILTRLTLTAGIAFSLIPILSPHSSLLMAQKAQSASAKPAQSSSQPVKVAATAPAVADAQPVITIHGLCGDRAAISAQANPANGQSSCSRIITREQFEKLMKILNPEGQAISLKGQQNFARTYAEFMSLEAAAHQAGMDETPEFHDLMQWMRLRTIADFYRRTLQEKYRSPSPEEIHAYYQQHLASYDRIRLSRILVPREDRAATDATNHDPADFDRRALNAARAAHARAAQGEDLSQIEKDAYAALGLQLPPPTELGSYGRSNFTDQEGAEVFSLKPGEVSQVETEPRSYVIYKVISKETLTEDQVKGDIAHEISQQKYKDEMKSASEKTPVEFNEEYFGPGISLPARTPAPPATPPR
jgi:hypothetical protein